MLVKDQLERAQLEDVTVVPASTIIGRPYYTTTGDRMLIDTGTIVKPVGGIEIDYIVTADDAADLKSALENNTYKMVFVPNGTYNMVANVIALGNNLQYVFGESRDGVIINSTAAGDFITQNANPDLVILRNMTFVHGTGANTITCIKGDASVDKRLFCENVVWDNWGRGMEGDNTYAHTRNMNAINCHFTASSGAVADGDFLLMGIMDNVYVDSSARVGSHNAVAGVQKANNVTIVLGRGDGGVVVGFQYGGSRILIGSGLNNCKVIKTINETVVGLTLTAYKWCEKVSNCRVDYDFDHSSGSSGTNFWGFWQCKLLTGCSAIVAGTHTVNCTVRGYDSCDQVSACYAEIQCTNASGNYACFYLGFNFAACYAVCNNASQYAFQSQQYIVSCEYDLGLAGAVSDAAANKFPDA